MLQLHCSECHEFVEQLIIPPLLDKQYNQYSFIKRLWNTAIQEVGHATEIIVWGYSIPPTDFYCEWLLRQINSYKCKSLTIINPELIIKADKKVDWNILFIKKYLNIFENNISIENIKFYEFFDDYNAGYDIMKKYKLDKID